MRAGTGRSRQPKPLVAGLFEGAISSFRLHLAAENKSAKTVRMYTEAVQWFAAARLRPETGLTSWEQVGKQLTLVAPDTHIIDRPGSQFPINEAVRRTYRPAT